MIFSRSLSFVLSSIGLLPKYYLANSEERVQAGDQLISSRGSELALPGFNRCSLADLLFLLDKYERRRTNGQFELERGLGLRSFYVLDLSVSIYLYVHLSESASPVSNLRSVLPNSWQPLSNSRNSELQRNPAEVKKVVPSLLKDVESTLGQQCAVAMTESAYARSCAGGTSESGVQTLKGQPVIA
ncbi:hypothetical protein L1887_48782 [Cichorium endivia]|nr:hypothetical protein L1887_48782 [Cichorium endivia]